MFTFSSFLMVKKAFQYTSTMNSALFEYSSDKFIESGRYFKDSIAKYYKMEYVKSFVFKNLSILY